jgi:hypothetical protein
MALYNRKGIFGNMNDSEEDLHRLLDRSFAAYDLEIRGCVALFTGYMSRAVSLSRVCGSGSRYC